MEGRNRDLSLPADPGKKGRNRSKQDEDSKELIKEEIIEIDGVTVQPTSSMPNPNSETVVDTMGSRTSSCLHA